MTVATLERRGLAPRVSPAYGRRAARALLAGLVRESTFVFVLSLALYLAATVFVVLHVGYINADAYSRVGSAYFVLFSRDPHLAAIGFVWPPLPTMFLIPLLALKNWFPALATMGLAGSIEGAAFSAGTALLLNAAMRGFGVGRAWRWLFTAAWIVNPMALIYATQGMSEAMFDFFAAGAVVFFLRWTRDRDRRQLFVCSVFAALGTLVREEMILISFCLALAVTIFSLAQSRRWREAETDGLLFFTPVVAALVIWFGATGVITGDPLYLFHSSYSAGQQAVTNNFEVTFTFGQTDWLSAATAIARRFFFVFPAILPLGAMLLLRLGLRDRLSAVLLLMLAMPIPLLHIYLLHRQTLSGVARYQMFVIPYSFLLAAFLVYEARRLLPRLAPVVSLLALLAVTAADVSQVWTLSDPFIAKEEAPLLTAIKQQETLKGAALVDINGRRWETSLADYAGQARVAREVARLATGRGLVAVDSFRGFSVVLNAPDPRLYVVTTDENFEAAIASPAAYHVGYFLVPRPFRLARLDRLNRIYPTLWDNGGGFATDVADLGTSEQWRLYRITSDTGR